MKTEEKNDDKQYLEYILASLKLINQYLKGFSEEKFENAIKIQDAVSYRMICIGRGAVELSDELKSKYDTFPWYLYSCFSYDVDEVWVIWDLYIANKEKKSNFESINSLYNELEKIYIKEYFPEKISNKEVKFDDDYKYPIKSKNSIWTVKSK